MPPRATARVRTGLRFLFPEGCYGRLAPRSSSSIAGIEIREGFIDPDYTGWRIH